MIPDSARQHCSISYLRCVFRERPVWMQQVRETGSRGHAGRESGGTRSSTRGSERGRTAFPANEPR